VNNSLLLILLSPLNAATLTLLTPAPANTPPLSAVSQELQQTVAPAELQPAASGLYLQPAPSGAVQAAGTGINQLPNARLQ
jgi:hypothetical protein